MLPSQAVQRQGKLKNSLQEYSLLRKTNNMKINYFQFAKIEKFSGPRKPEVFSVFKLSYKNCGRKRV